MGMSSAVTGLIPKSVSGKMMGMGTSIATNVRRGGIGIMNNTAKGSTGRAIGRSINNAGKVMQAHPLRTAGGAMGAAGLGAAAMSRRRGSQNYPMY